jgi:hypothetical protein
MVASETEGQTRENLLTTLMEMPNDAWQQVRRRKEGGINIY